MKTLLGTMFTIMLFSFSNADDQDDEKCQQYFGEIITSITNGELPSNISPQTILSSGKGIQDLGSYIVCRDQSDLHYIHLRMISNSKAVHMGFCLPQYCDMDYLQRYNDTTKEIINNITKAQYDKEMIDSVSFLDPDLSYPEWSSGTYITIIIFCLIIILNVLGSTLTMVAENRKQVYEEQLSLEIKKSVQDKINESKQQDSKLQDSLQSSYAQSEIIQNDIIENQEQAFMSDVGKLDTKYRYKEPSWSRLALSFSFIQNYQKLFKIEEPKGENQGFAVFNGIRALSIFWVIFGHDQLIRGTNSYNLIDIPYKMTEAGWVTLTPAAYFAVDTFFFVGGFLAAVLLLEKLQKLKKIKLLLIPTMWLHRILRIWPTYAFCLLIYWQLTIYWSDGPIWNEYIQIACNCDGQWWKNLLFIDNMFSHESGGLKYCFGWGWYLANDFQIFLITPILLIIYAKNKKLGLFVISTLLIGSILSAYLIAYTHEYHLSLGNQNGKPQPDYQDTFYYKPWIRISPYLIGMLFGLLYRKIKNGKNEKLNLIAQKIRTSYTIRALLYFFGIALTQTVIWIIIPLQKDMNAWPQQAQYFYQAFNRVFFVFGVALCITPALLGVKNDPSRLILGHPFWVPIARISFCMYLTHFIVIFFMTFSSTQLTYYQYSHILFFTLTDIIYTIVVAALLSLAVEMPFLNLEKILFAPKKKYDTKDSEFSQGKDRKLEL